MRYILLLFLGFFLNTAANAVSADCTELGNWKYCTCANKAPYIALDGENCVLPPPTAPVDPLNPQCVSGFDAYNVRGATVCYRSCPAPSQRDFDDQGYALNSCIVICGPKGDFHWSYDVDKQACTYTCFQDEEMIDGHCELKCESDQVRDPITKQCKTPVPDPEPEPEGCDGSVVESINCLKTQVTNSLNDLKTSFTDGFDRFNDLLTQILNKESNSTNPGDDWDTPHDPNDLNAETSIQEINPSDFLDQDKFVNNSSCPVDNSISFWGHVYTFSYSRICNSLEMIGYFILTLAYAFAAFIIVRKT